MDPAQDGTDFLNGQDDGQVLWTLGANQAVEPRKLDAKHLAVGEEDGAQGLVLSGSGDPVADG